MRASAQGGGQHARDLQPPQRVGDDANRHGCVRARRGRAEDAQQPVGPGLRWVHGSAVEQQRDGSAVERALGVEQVGVQRQLLLHGAPDERVYSLRELHHVHVLAAVAVEPDEHDLAQVAERHWVQRLLLAGRLEQPHEQCDKVDLAQLAFVAARVPHVVVQQPRHLFLRQRRLLADRRPNGRLQRLGARRPERPLPPRKRVVERLRRAEVPRHHVQPRLQRSQLGPTLGQRDAGATSCIRVAGTTRPPAASRSGVRAAAGRRGAWRRRGSLQTLRIAQHGGSDVPGGVRDDGRLQWNVQLHLGDLQPGRQPVIALQPRTVPALHVRAPQELPKPRTGAVE